MACIKNTVSATLALDQGISCFVPNEFGADGQLTAHTIELPVPPDAQAQVSQLAPIWLFANCRKCHASRQSGDDISDRAIMLLTTARLSLTLRAFVTLQMRRSHQPCV